MEHLAYIGYQFREIEDTRPPGTSSKHWVTGSGHLKQHVDMHGRKGHRVEEGEEEQEEE